MSKRSLSSSLSPPPLNSESKSTSKKPRLSSSIDFDIAPDEYQQVTYPPFVSKYKLHNLQGGDCYYMPNMISEEEAKVWYDELLNLDSYQPTLKMYGKSHIQSRHIAAYSTQPNLLLKYSGTDIDMKFPFPDVLERIKRRVEDVLSSTSSSGGNDGQEGGIKPQEGGRVKFNHCMLNKYENGSIYIGKHSDNLENKVIASLSLGAERTLILHPRDPSKKRQRKAQPIKGDGVDGEGPLHEAVRETIKLKLGNGSLFVMQGSTQEFWKHEIPKEPKVKEGRISLTFRQLVYD